MGKVISENNTVCYHCGEECRGERIHFHEKDFCCVGCKSVFEILEQNELCTYYSITRSPGVSQQLPRVASYYDFLDDVMVLIGELWYIWWALVSALYLLCGV